MNKVYVAATAIVAMAVGTLANAQTAEPAGSGAQDSAATAAAVSESSDPTQLQEVVVTAERHSESLQKVASSITAIDGRTIEQQTATDLSQVLQDVPGVIVQYQDNTGFGGPPPIAIRGIGTDSGSQAVAVYEDGVYIPASGAFFYDLNRVEVLRGPQGTLYGQGSVGGAINLIDTAPSQSFGGTGQLEYGSYDLVHASGAFNAPLGDALAMRVSINEIKHNGFDANGFGNEDELNTKVKFLYHPSADFSLLVGAVAYSSDDAGPVEAPVSTSGALNGWNDPDPAGGNKHIEYKRYYANLVWDAGPFVLTYIPAYQTWSEAGLTYGGPGKIVDGLPESNLDTQELRFSNPDGSTLKWVGGAYYYRDISHVGFAGAIMPPGAPPDTYLQVVQETTQTRTTNAALFGEVTYPITGAVRLTGGIRETWTTIPYSEQDLIFFVPADYVSRTNYKHFDWKARVEEDVGPGNLVYESVTTGSRSGGPAVDGTIYGPETMKAFEVGSKNRFYNDRVQVNAAAYFYDYGGFQESVILTAPNNPSVLVGEGVATVPARMGGVEIEAILKLTPNDQLEISPAFEKGHYTANYSSSGVLNLTDGKTPTHMPKWTIGATYSHRFDLPGDHALTAMADVHYQGEQINTFNPDVYNDAADRNVYLTGAYCIGDFWLTFGPRAENYSIGAYVRNVANTEYKYDIFPG